MGIYSYELFNFFGVEQIIRIGSCGAFSPDLHVRDLILAMGACTNSYFASQYRLPGTFCPLADFDLLRRAADSCARRGLRCRVGNILSSDTFYDDAGSGMDWAKMGVLGVEMESAALYCTAARAWPPRALHLHGERLLRVSGRVHLRRRARDFLYRHDGGRAGSGVRQGTQTGGSAQGKTLRRAAKNQGVLRDPAVVDARDLAVPEGEGQSRAATNVHQRIAGLLADAQRVRDILPGGADRQSLRGLDRIVGQGDCIDRVTLGSGNRIDREAGVPGIPCRCRECRRRSRIH